MIQVQQTHPPIPEHAAALLRQWQELDRLRAWQVRKLCECLQVGPHKRRQLFGRESKARIYLRGGGHPRYDRRVVLDYLGLL